MIRLTYRTPWDVAWESDSSTDESWLHKEFTFKDMSDFRHKSQFGYFPEVVTVDTNARRMTHGQAIHLRRQAKGDGRTVEIVDSNPRISIETGPIAPDFLPGIELRDYQRLATQAIAGVGHGIVQAGTGAGKTVIMGALLKVLVEQTDVGIMIMIFSKDLLNQTARRFVTYGVPEQDIGIIHSDYSLAEQEAAAKKRVILTTHLSIAKFPGTIARTRYVICDEAHEAMGPLWSKMIGSMPNITNVIGFTATPWDDDDERHKMLAIFGQVIVNIPVKYLVDKGLLMNPEIYFIKLVYPDRDKKLVAGMSWQAAEKLFIHEDKPRNMLPAVALKKFGGRMLVLYDNLKHGAAIQDLTSPHFPTMLAEGKTSTKHRENAIRWFEKDCDHGESGKVLLGSEIFEQGVDLDGGCDILFIAGSSKKRRKNIQRLGRALRINRTGRLRVFVPWDANHPKIAKWSGEKKKLFKDLGFEDRIQTITLDEFATLA